MSQTTAQAVRVLHLHFARVLDGLVPSRMDTEDKADAAKLPEVIEIRRTSAHLVDRQDPEDARRGYVLGARGLYWPKPIPEPDYDAMPDAQERAKDCRCSGCGLTFHSVKSFDAHRTGTFTPPARRCMTAPELLAQGWHQRKAGTWVTPWKPAPHAWRMPEVEHRV